MRTLAIAVLVMVLNPRASECQSQAPRLPWSHGDVTASTGFFTANHVVSGKSGGPDWSASLFRGLGAGVYWSEHLKTEIEAGWPGTTEAYGYFSTRLPDGSTSSTYEEHTFHAFDVSASLLYQFGRNSFFHPFVGTGIQATRERDEIERTTQTSRGRVSTDLVDTIAVRTRPFVTTGFKAYVSDRAFFRGDVKLDVGSRVEQVVWRAGVGVDF
jgi:Outer membrane protein beta-barrel domain